MDKKNNFIINLIIYKRNIIEKIFALLVILSIIEFPFVKVNYDLTEYLPETAPSKIAINKLEDQFSYPGTARVMVEDVSLYEAKIIKDKIVDVDGVDMVNWADSITDVYQSNSFIDYSKIDDYYKDNCSVMDIVFKEGDTSNRTSKAIDEIKNITGDKGYFSGPAVENKSLNETLKKEMGIAVVLAIVIIAAILCLTTTAWFEPVLFLTVMGIAVIINMGSNIFLGTVSFLTYSIAAVLQLAVAMDYSIFLLHSFTREKDKGLSEEEAIANAIRLSVKSILSSGATTIVGFLALTIMNFSIGYDMGLVLAKGIVISIVSVLFLMPSLILRFSAKIEKSTHKPFTPTFEKLGQVLYKARYPIIVISLILALPSYVAQNMNDFLYGNESLGASPGTVVYSDSQEINKHFGRSNLILAIVPNTSNVTEKRMVDELKSLEDVKSVTSLADTMPEGVPEMILPNGTRKLLHTDSYARVLIYTKTKGESTAAFNASDKVKDIINVYYSDENYVTGVTPSTQDIKRIITDDYNKVNVVSMVGVLIIMIITFRSLIVPLVVIVPIEVATFVNMGLPYVYGQNLIYMGYIIVSSLQLGATIDYSILLTGNYLDFREEYDKAGASKKAIQRSALSILTSGTILTCVGYALYFVSSVEAIADIGRLIGRGALFSVLLVLGLLPALLVCADKIIFHKTNVNLKKIKIKDVKGSIRKINIEDVKQRIKKIKIKDMKENIKKINIKNLKQNIKKIKIKGIEQGIKKNKSRKGSDRSEDK